MNHIRNQRTRKPVTFEDLILTAASRCQLSPEGTFPVGLYALAHGRKGGLHTGGLYLNPCLRHKPFGDNRGRWRLGNGRVAACPPPPPRGLRPGPALSSWTATTRFEFRGRAPPELTERFGTA